MEVTTLVPTILEGELPGCLAGIVREYLNPMVDCLLCQEAGCANVAMGFGDTGFRCRGHASPNTAERGICFRIGVGDAYHVGVKDAVETLFKMVWRMNISSQTRGAGSALYRGRLEAMKEELDNLKRLPLDM
jgi:hypothetical protein